MQPSRQPDVLRRFTRWMEATPHPPLAIEVAPDRVAGARFTRTGALESFGVADVSKGAIVPSAIEANILNAPRRTTRYEAFARRWPRRQRRLRYCYRIR